MAKPERAEAYGGRGQPATAGQPVGEFERAASVLRAMAHPTRLTVICGLLKRPSTLTEICAVLPVPQSTLAQHLAVLRRAGIIRGARHGRDVRFSVVDDAARHIMALLCARASAGAPWSDPAGYADTGDMA